MFRSVEFFEFFSVLAFAGIAAFQIPYISAQWFYIRRKEYLFYLLYIIFIAIYCLSKFNWLAENSKFLSLIERNMDMALPILSYFLYYRFARHFLDLKDNNPKINLWCKYVELFLLSYIAIEICMMALLGFHHDQREFLFIGTSAVLGISTISLIAWLFKEGEKIGYFIIAGALLLTISALSGMIMHLIGYNKIHPTLPVVYSTLIEFLIFNTGLAYKARLFEQRSLILKQENIRQLEERILLQREIAQHRERAAREIHNELGSGISDIHIFSAMAEKELSGESEKAILLNKQIRQRAIHLLDKVQDIIWAMSPQTTSIGHLEARLTQLCREKLNPESIPWKIEINRNARDIVLNPDALRKCMSIFREGLKVAQQNDLQEIIIEGNEKQLSFHYYLNKEAINETLNNLDYMIKQQDGKLIPEKGKLQALLLLTNIRD